MNILVVCQYYFPENFQITPICEELVNRGHKVTVLTGLPNYPSGIVPEEYKKGHRDEMINGVHVIRCHEIGRSKGVVHLALNYFSFWHSSKKAVMHIKEKFDFVFVYQLSPITMCCAGIKYAKKHDVPLVMYCCDLWPESLKMYIKNERNLVFKYFKKISTKIYNSADLIAVQSSSFLPYLKEVHNIDNKKLMYLPAFADDKYLEHKFEFDNGVIDFVFLGNLGIAQDLFSVLEAIKLARDVPNFKFHFVGTGSCFEKMKKYVAENDLGDKVVFYGRRPVEEMPDFYRLADVCVVSLKADNKTGLTLPSKVQGYMAAGKPILGMINGSAQEVINESNCGVCVDSGNIESFAAAIKDFVANYNNYSSCGENGRDYFKNNFKKEIFMERLEEIFNGIRRA